jgi:hypothetical protein
MRRVIALTILVTSIAAILLIARSARGFDFSALYCAGKVAAAGQNPFLAMPLHRCEANQTDPALMHFLNGATLPAPFPGYVVAGMEPLSIMPFATAHLIWTLLLIGAIIGCVAVLRRLTGSSATFISAALCLSVGIPAVGFGEPIPFFLLALCLCALFVKRHQWVAASVAAAACLVEPHLGVPVWLALFVWCRQTRPYLVASAFALATLSIVTLGVQENIEYITRVLPLHALSEIGSDQQFSLSAVLHAFGIADAWDIQIGFWSYVLMTIIGVMVAKRAAGALGNEGFFVTVPAATALVAGSFVHITQIAAAIPIALLLTADMRNEYRLTALIALLFLAIPWLWSSGAVFIAFAVIFAFYIVWEATGENARASGACAFAVLALLVGLQLWSNAEARRAAVARGDGTVSKAIATSGRYPEASWAEAIRRYRSDDSAVSWAYRVPTWCGLLLITGTVCLATRRRNTAPARGVGVAA